MEEISRDPEKRSYLSLRGYGEGAWRKYHEETQKRGRICRGEGKEREHGGNIMRRPRQRSYLSRRGVKGGSVKEIP